MNRRLAPAHRLAALGALLLAVSFALVGCAEEADSGKEGPITSRMNAIYTGDAADARWRADNNRMQEVVAACMKEKGFEYTPVPVADDAVPLRGGDDDRDPIADAEKHGYWVTPASVDELRSTYAPAPPEEVPHEPSDDDPASSVTGDPNGAYYLSLSDSERAAYDEALYGSDGTAWNDPTASCSGEASHEVFEAEADDEVDSTVIDDFNTYADDKVADDSRVREAEASWVSCMADEGHPFASSTEARQSIERRFTDLTGIDTTGWSTDEVDRDRVTSVTEAELTDLHDDEIATATADARCYAKAGLEDARDDAWLDAETKFYSSHKTEVDAYFEALEATQTRG